MPVIISAGWSALFCEDDWDRSWHIFVPVTSSLASLHRASLFFQPCLSTSVWTGNAQGSREAGFCCDYANHGNHGAFSPFFSPDGRCLEIWAKHPKIRVCQISKCKSTAPASEGPLETGLRGLARVPEGPHRKTEITGLNRLVWF